MNSFRSNFLPSLAERFCWYLFLLWLLLASLASAQFNGVSWMLLSCVLYSLSSLYLVSIMFGSAYNIKALKRNRLIILIAALSLLWLYLQTVLPISNRLSQTMNFSADSGAWLQPSSRVSIDPSRTLWLLYSYLPAFVCMLLSCSMLNSRTRVKQLLYLFTLLFLLHVTAGIYAKYAGFYLIDKDQLDGHWSAARGWFVNRNHFAAFILTSLVGVITFLTYRSHSKKTILAKLALITLVIISFVAIVLSQSRAGLACWMLTMLIVWLTSIRGQMGAGQSGRLAKHSVGFILACLVVFTSVGFIFGAELWGRLVHSSLSIGERGLQWEITWSAIQRSPWFGYGGGSYAQVFQYFREFAELRQVLFDQSHNHYLQIFLEQGLLGLTLWLTLISMVAARAILTIRNAKSALIVSATAAAGLALVAALVQSLVDFNLQIINLRCFFFVIIGLILALPTVRNNQDT